MRWDNNPRQIHFVAVWLHALPRGDNCTGVAADTPAHGHVRFKASQCRSCRSTVLGHVPKICDVKYPCIVDQDSVPTVLQPSKLLFLLLESP